MSSEACVRCVELNAKFIVGINIVEQEYLQCNHERAGL